jgi:Endoribonuclease L-PSP
MDPFEIVMPMYKASFAAYSQLMIKKLKKRIDAVNGPVLVENMGKECQAMMQIITQKTGKNNEWQMVLQVLWATLKDVVRTRIYVTDINNWQEVGRAHAEYFKQIRPATTTVEVCRLINAEILVEMEVDVIVTDAEVIQVGR